MWPEHCNFFLCCYTWLDFICIWGVVLVLIGSNVFIIKSRWDRCLCRITCRFFYEKLNIIKQVFPVLEWIILVDYFWKNDQFPCPWCKIVLKSKILSMKINYKAQLIKENCLVRPPYKKDKNRKMINKRFWLMFTLFLWAPFYLRIFLPKYRELY